MIFEHEATPADVKRKWSYNHVLDNEFVQANLIAKVFS